MKEGMVLSIDSDAFAEIRLSFDRVMETVFKKMRTRDSDEAKITLDVTISLENVKTTDLKTGEIMQVKNPNIKYAIKHKLEYKNDGAEAGQIQRADSYLACVDGRWQIFPIEDGQMTIAEYVQQGGRK